jgi:hypothetical protein
MQKKSAFVSYIKWNVPLWSTECNLRAFRKDTNPEFELNGSNNFPILGQVLFI